MIAVTRKKMGISISDVFFARSPVSVKVPPASVSFFVQASEYHPGFTPFKTQVIDLTRSEADISSTLSKNTRYKILRAEREGLTPTVETRPSPEKIAEYSSFYDEFSRQKGLQPCNTPKLTALSRIGALALTSVTNSSGDPLAAHAYVCDGNLGRVRLLYSASHFRDTADSGERNLIGRANRLLHWFEIVEFKRLSYERYDLGGLPLDESDPVKNAIARFKLEFGGEHVIEYNGLIPRTLFGRAALSLRRRFT